MIEHPPIKQLENWTVTETPTNALYQDIGQAVVCLAVFGLVIWTLGKAAD
jgi:hypothetical protein